MKRIFFTAILFYSVTSIFAQNIQLHYDMGENRNCWTSTIEYFKPDNIGSTFFFVDFNYGGKGNGYNHATLAYWEIARNFKIKKFPIELHAEFNAGLGHTKYFGFPVNNAALLGGSYTMHSADFSKILTLNAMYKRIFEKENDGKDFNSYQLTAVWTINMFKNKLSFTGFADFWREDFNINGEDKKFVFLSEPQIWYNINKKFSIGGEIELSNNFSYNDGFMANPTIAIKWNL